MFSGLNDCIPSLSVSYGNIKLDNRWTFRPPDLILERHSAPRELFHCDSNAPSSQSQKWQEDMEGSLGNMQVIPTR